MAGLEVGRILEVEGQDSVLEGADLCCQKPWLPSCWLEAFGVEASSCFPLVEAWALVEALASS